MGSIGKHHSALLDAAGAVWTAGRGAEGQLGHGSDESSSLLQRVEGLPVCTVVSAGTNFTACVSEDGQVFCFGSNQDGQLGQGHLESRHTPQPVAGLPPIRTLACGHAFVLCVGRDSSLWSFGANGAGQLGLGHTEPVTVPSQVKGVKAYQVACGYDHALILAPDGHVYACGGHASGQLGLKTETLTSYPVFVPLPFAAASVHCGHWFSLIKATDGTLWTAGHGGHGRLGLGDTSKRIEFTMIPDLTVSEVVCGYTHTVAVDGQNRLWGWGANGCRQLSSRLGSYCHTPSILRENVRRVLAGHHHTFALTTEGEVMACGFNQDGQLVNGATSSSCWTTPHLGANVFTVSQSYVPPESLWIMDWQAFHPFLSLTPHEQQTLQEIHTLSRHAHLALFKNPSERLCPAPYTLGTWHSASSVVQDKVEGFTAAVAHRDAKREANQAEIAQCEQTIEQLQQELEQQRTKLLEMKQHLETLRPGPQESNQRDLLQALGHRCQALAVAEEQQRGPLERLLEENTLSDLEVNQMDLVWWRCGLTGRQADELKEYGFSGDVAARTPLASWQQAGLSVPEICRLQFTTDMLAQPGGLSALERLDQTDCIVCSCCTIPSTLELLTQRDIKIKQNVIEERGWIAPHLVYAPLTTEDCDVESKAGYFSTLKAIEELKKAHRRHLSRSGSSSS